MIPNQVHRHSERSSDYVLLHSQSKHSPNDEINRYMKMEKLLENKISRRFKVRRLEINDFGYLMEHLYGRDGIAYEDYEYQLPKKKLQKETLIKYYDLIRPTRCVIEESQRYLRLEHEDKESYVSYFTVNAIVGELKIS